MRAGGERVGAVLAAGRSRRYGRPKGLEEVGGVAMTERALDALRPHVAALLLVGARDDSARCDIALRRDARPGCGPLGGLETALSWAVEGGAAHLLVLACDLPLVDADTVGDVAAAIGPDADAVVPRTSAGPQPLCAAYRVTLLPEVGRLLDAGAHSLRGLLAGVRVRWLDGAGLRGGVAAFTNVNTPRERELAEALLHERTKRLAGSGE